MFNKKSEKESRSKYIYVVSSFNSDTGDTELRDYIFSTFEKASRYFFNKLTSRANPCSELLKEQVRKVYNFNEKTNRDFCFWVRVECSKNYGAFQTQCRGGSGIGINK